MKIYISIIAFALLIFFAEFQIVLVVIVQNFAENQIIVSKSYQTNDVHMSSQTKIMVLEANYPIKIGVNFQTSYIKIQKLEQLSVYILKGYEDDLKFYNADLILIQSSNNDIKSISNQNNKCIYDTQNDLLEQVKICLQKKKFTKDKEKEVNPNSSILLFIIIVFLMYILIAVKNLLIIRPETHMIV